MDDSLDINESTTAADVLGWDSLANISLMAAIEKQLGVKFTGREIESFKRVGDLVRNVDEKLTPSAV